MGWCFTYNCCRAELIDDLTREESWKRGDGTQVTRLCLARTYKGTPYAGILYAVFEDQVAGRDPHRFIAVFLMRVSHKDGFPSWGYKDMDESMGPYAGGCPLKYLDMVPWCERLLTCPPTRLREDGKWDVMYDGQWQVRDEAPWQWAAAFRRRTRECWKARNEKARQTRERRKAAREALAARA